MKEIGSLVRNIHIINLNVLLYFVGQINGKSLKIGNTTVPLNPNHALKALVPDVLFYENQQV